MPKYTITYVDHPDLETDEHPLLLVNERPNPLPAPNVSWSNYRHGGKTVVQIRTHDVDAALVVVPSKAAALSDQNVKAALGVVAGQDASWAWSEHSAGLRLDMRGDAMSTTFDLTDAHLPPQALRIVVKLPIAASGGGFGSA